MAISFDTTNGSPTVTVNDPLHGASVGDYVLFERVSGLSSQLNSDLADEFVIQTVPNNNSYTITLPQNADATYTSDGIAAAFYPLATGLATTVLGPGWGAGTWGRFTWGSAVGSLAGQTLRLWSGDNFGEDLIFNVEDGEIFYWDASGGVTSRAYPLSSYTGANEVPTVARKILVSEADRHVIAFGTNPIGSTQQDPLLIRFSDQENPSDWNPTATNTAGDLRLSQGSEIITAVRTTRQVLVWTDASLHSLQFIGPPFTFGTALLGDNVRIAGPNAAIGVNDTVFWMGQSNFYVFDGRIQPIPCTVRDYVFSDINTQQSFKIFAGSLGSQNEVWWFYPSANSTENDRYVVYNYAEQIWYYGQLARTAWNDRATGQRSFPQATGTDGYLYDHENGLDADGSAMDSFITSSDFDIGDGEQFMLIRRILPDLSFRGSTAENPEVDFTVTAKNFSGDGVDDEATGTVVRQTLVGGSHDYTDQLFMRARGRQLALKVSSDTTGVKWRIGAPRLDARPDGRR
jgi:hypothetical protein